MNLSQPSLKISVFGKFEMRYADNILADFESRKAQELFCYLLLHRTQPSLRETLAELLWDKSPDVQVRKCLRQALWKLQGALNLRVEFNQGELLVVTPAWVQVNPQVPLWLDVAEFELHFNAVRDVSVENLGEPQIDAMQSAVALYRGDLLEGLYSDWCLAERERFRDMYLMMLDKLMAYSEISQAYDAGLVYGMRILGYDQALESVHRRMMRLYYFSGNRTKALRQYERCAQILSQELDVKPANRTQELYKQIKADQLEDRGLEIHRGQADSLLVRQDQLKELLGDLVELEGQLRHKIQLAEQAVGQKIFS